MVRKFLFFVKCLQTAVKAVAEVYDLYLSSQDLAIVHEIVSFSIAAKYLPIGTEVVSSW